MNLDNLRLELSRSFNSFTTVKGASSMTRQTRQLVKERLLAGSLLALSAGGTLVLFGAVPMVAHVFSSPPPSWFQQAERQHLPNWRFSEQQPLRSNDRS